ncbi:metallophosphoesterase [bacterium]|nr:metallophosphoesterase [bacterium]
MTADNRAVRTGKLFIRLSVLVAAFLACACSSKPRPLDFIALSDTHIASGEDLGRLRRLLYTVRDRGQFVLITGDICAQAPEYEENVREICAQAPLPVYVLPGNHDDNYARSPQWWSAVFGPLARTFEAGGYEFVLNWSQDSLRCRQWLDSLLAATPAGKHLVYAQHYPPGKFGDTALPLLEGRAQDIVLCLSGHTHTHNLDTLACGVVSLTLSNCSMDSTRDGRFYEIRLDSGRLTAVRSFAFDSLALDSLPDTPPTLALADSSVCLVLDSARVVAGQAWDDRAVTQVEFSLDYGPWRKATGTDSFSLALDPLDLSPGPHYLLVRARDSAGALSDGFAARSLYVPEPQSPSGVVELWNGHNGYDGCLSATVRAQQPTACLAGADLECWTYGRRGEQEFSEFYLAYDLGGLRPPAGKRVESLELELFCCRQNSLSPAGGDDLYRVGLPGSGWDSRMTFATRPALPAWSAQDSGAVSAPLSGEWSEQADGRQEVRPETPVRVDLSAFIPQFERWLAHPEQNHGWVVSPVRSNYNITFRGGSYAVPSLRPRLIVRFN